jgi:hypothetical protein
MAKKATTKTGATGTMGSTGVNDPTSGGGNDPFGGTEGVPDNPTGGKPTEQGGGTTPTGGGGTSGLSDTSFDDDVSVKKKPPRARIVDFIINTCGFPEDSTMVKVIDQQGWEELHSVVSMDIEKIKDFTVRNEHGLYEEKPLLVHLTFMKGFILLY